MHEDYPTLTDYTLQPEDDYEFFNYYDGYLAGKIMFDNKWHYYNCFDILDDHTRLYNVYELTDNLIQVLNSEWKYDDIQKFNPILKLKW